MKSITYVVNESGVRCEVGAGRVAVVEHTDALHVMPLFGVDTPTLRVRIWLEGDGAKVHAAYEQAIRTCAAISALWEADAKKRNSTIASYLGDGSEKEAA